METYGVTPADLVAQDQNLAIDALSTPSTTTVETMIERAAAIVEGEALAIGITTPATVNGTYLILQKMTIFQVLADIYAARNGGVDVATFYSAQYAAMLKSLRTRATAMSETDNTSDRTSTYRPRTARAASKWFTY